MSRRQPRPGRTFRRQAPTRAPYDVVLIVCEGEKTEPEYLKGLRAAYRLSNANITIAPADGNDPVSVVRHAIDAYQRAKGEINRVFCVFDRDGHANRVVTEAGKITVRSTFAWSEFDCWISVDSLHFIRNMSTVN